MLTSNITSKGQVTLPVSFRKHLNLNTGDKVSFKLEGDKIIAEAVPTKISSLFGLIESDQNVTLEQMDEIIKKSCY